MSTKSVKSIKNKTNYNKLGILKNSYINKITQFWRDNTWIDKILLQDIKCANTETREGDIIISLHPEYFIIDNGENEIDEDADYYERPYSRLCVEDLDMICDLINGSQIYLGFLFNI